MTFQQIADEARQRAGLTWDEVAERMGVGPARLRSMLFTTLRFDDLLKIIEACDLKLDWKLIEAQPLGEIDVVGH